MITGAGAPHKPYLCERIPPPACWCCTGGMGCSQRPQTTKRVGGLAGMCHLWPGRWYCIPGNTQGILSSPAHYCLLHSPWGETFPALCSYLNAAALHSPWGETFPALCSYLNAAALHSPDIQTSHVVIYNGSDISGTLSRMNHPAVLSHMQSFYAALLASACMLDSTSVHPLTAA